MLPLIAPLLLQMLAPPRAAAQERRLDSLRVHREARSAQADFERQRRHRLPQHWGSSAGRCDVRLGRFCYWHDEDALPGPEEPATIPPLRADLTSRLDEAADLLPGDRWIAGQRVRYLVESGHSAQALDAVAECRADAWWCSALAGLVLHAEQSFAEADSAFDLALRQMPAAQRCTWEDVTDLLPPRASRAYRALSCDERREWLAPVWTLADPMWTRPGNDRRTEHYARLVMSRLERDAGSPYNISWGEDSHELIVRYGWPHRWSREHSSSLDPTVLRIIGYEPHPAFDFFPNDSGIRDPSAVTNAGWDLRARDARSRYAPAYARIAMPLQAQVTRFFRGDSVLVIAAFEVPRDTAFGATTPRAALAIDTSSLGNSPLVQPVELRGALGLARAMVSAGHALVGVEVTDTSHGSLARARAALDATNRSEIGILLYAAPRAGDATLDDVVDRSLGAARVSRRERLGLYWEVESPRVTADSVMYVLTVYPRSANWLTRLARSMRLADAAAPVHLRFTEWRGAEPRTSRALALDLSHLPPGTYDIRVRVEAAGAEVGSGTRTVEVAR
ncbi:MAG: hypothetical protein ACT4P7_01840 [Gemmatimonadaceae bacterium]